MSSLTVILIFKDGAEIQKAEETLQIDEDRESSESIRNNLNKKWEIVRQRVGWLLRK